MVVKHHLKVISHQSFICEGAFFQLPNLNPVLNWLLGHVLAFSSDLFRSSFPFVRFPSIPFHNFSSRIDNHANTMSSHLDLWCFNLYFTVAIHKPSHNWALSLKPVARLRPLISFLLWPWSSLFLLSHTPWACSSILIDPAFPRVFPAPFPAPSLGSTCLFTGLASAWSGTREPLALLTFLLAWHDSCFDYSLNLFSSTSFLSFSHMSPKCVSWVWSEIHADSLNRISQRLADILLLSPEWHVTFANLLQLLSPAALSTSSSLSEVPTCPTATENLSNLSGCCKLSDFLPRFFLLHLQNFCVQFEMPIKLVETKDNDNIKSWWELCFLRHPFTASGEYTRLLEEGTCKHWQQLIKLICTYVVT